MSKPTDIFGKEPEILPTTDKRYPLFNFVVTSLYEQKSLELVTESLAHAKMLETFDDLLEAHKDHPKYDAKYQEDLKKEIAEFKTLAEDLKKDATSCEKKTKLTDFIETSARKHDWENIIMQNGVETLFDDYQVYLRTFRQTFPEAVARYLNDVEGIQQKMSVAVSNIREDVSNKVLEQMKTFISGFYDHLREAIQHFITTLDDNDKTQFAKVYQWCEEYLAAKTPSDVYYAFYGFESLVASNPIYLHFGDRDASVCRWDYKTITNFYSMIYMHLRPEH